MIDALESPGLIAFAKGVGTGLSVAVPMGPIGVLCLRRSVHGGRLAGMACGLGAATGDGIYGCIAAFGLTIISGFLLRYSGVVHIVGGLYMVWLGVKIALRSHPHLAGPARSKPAGWTDYLSTLGLTVISPVTVVLFIAIFSGLGLASDRSTTTSTLLAGGVFLGSATWFMILAVSAGSLRSRLRDAHLRWVNMVSGFAIFCFAVKILLSEVLRRG